MSRGIYTNYIFLICKVPSAGTCPAPRRTPLLSQLDSTMGDHLFYANTECNLIYFRVFDNLILNFVILVSKLSQNTNTTI